VAKRVERTYDNAFLSGRSSGKYVNLPDNLGGSCLKQNNLVKHAAINAEQMFD